MAKSPRSQEAANPQEAAAPQAPATVETPATPPAPPPPLPPAETTKDQRKMFAAVFNIVDGATTYAPGETTMLTRVQFDALKPLGAIEGEWE